MYPLRHKIAASLILLISFVTLLYFIVLSLLRLDGHILFIQRIVFFSVIVSAAAIIVAPIVLGSLGNWLCFFSSATCIGIISLGLSRPAYNLQSGVLLGVCVAVHLFHKRTVPLLEENESTAQKLKEATNLIESQCVKIEELSVALGERLKRYRELRQIGESFCAKLSFDEIYQMALDTAYAIAPGTDAALFFAVDETKQRLELCASKATSHLPRVKSKEGDIFDHWVFKERQPLGVSDVYDDFRFDYNPAEKERMFSSLISVPLISQSRIAGILRLNSKKKNAYTFDDLRLLSFIGDMVASAVNNAHLYKTTEDLATKDSLTGFFVHRYFKQRLDQEMERVRLTGAALSLIIFDIDHFKDYNDRYGHSAGDKALIEIANIIRRHIKQAHIAARYGGEEIAILMPKAHKQTAHLLAEAVREEISLHKFFLRRQETKVTISAGVVEYGADMRDSEELLKKADFCLYKAKKEGRNKVCVA